MSLLPGPFARNLVKGTFRIFCRKPLLPEIPFTREMINWKLFCTNTLFALRVLVFCRILFICRVLSSFCSSFSQKLLCVIWKKIPQNETSRCKYSTPKVIGSFFPPILSSRKLYFYPFTYPFFILLAKYN